METYKRHKILQKLPIVPYNFTLSIKAKFNLMALFSLTFLKLRYLYKQILIFFPKFFRFPIYNIFLVKKMGINRVFGTNHSVFN